MYTFAIRKGIDGINWESVLDDFRTFKWPRASDLKELVVGSRA